MKAPSRPSLSPRACREGQSLVEFALVLPLFLLLVLAVVDGGRAVFAYNQMGEVVRNVARVASTTCFRTAAPCDADVAGPIKSAIDSQGAGLQGPVTWTVQCVDPATAAPATPCKVGWRVRVAASTSFSLITPVAAPFGPVSVGSATEQEILQ